MSHSCPDGAKNDCILNRLFPRGEKGGSFGRSQSVAVQKYWPADPSSIVGQNFFHNKRRGTSGSLSFVWKGRNERCFPGKLPEFFAWNGKHSFFSSPVVLDPAALLSSLRQRPLPRQDPAPGGRVPRGEPQLALAVGQALLAGGGVIMDAQKLLLASELEKKKDTRM